MYMPKLPATSWDTPLGVHYYSYCYSFSYDCTLPIGTLNGYKGPLSVLMYLGGSWEPHELYRFSGVTA